MPITPHWLRALLSATPRPPARTGAGRGHRAALLRGVRVPIRELRERHRERIADLLLALSPEDRHLRFGYAASDAQVRGYVRRIDFASDAVLGIFNRRLQLIAMAHVAYGTEPQGPESAEFGVTVAACARGRGLGARLFERALMLARSRGVDKMLVHALSANVAMLKIARNAGASVQCLGSESEAYLQLPPADLPLKLSARLAAQIAEVDYRLKSGLRRGLRLLRDVQEVRQGVRAARRRAAQ